jgi:hypothetical protein
VLKADALKLSAVTEQLSAAQQSRDIAITERADAIAAFLIPLLRRSLAVARPLAQAAKPPQAPLVARLRRVPRRLPSAAQLQSRPRSRLAVS